MELTPETIGELAAGAARVHALEIPGGPVCHVRLVPGTEVEALAECETANGMRVANYCALFLSDASGAHLALAPSSLAKLPAAWLAQIFNAGMQVNGLEAPDTGE